MRYYIPSLAFSFAFLASAFFSVEVKVPHEPTVMPVEAGPKHETYQDEYDCYQYECWGEEA